MDETHLDIGVPDATGNANEEASEVDWVVDDVAEPDQAQPDLRNVLDLACAAPTVGKKDTPRVKSSRRV